MPKKKSFILYAEYIRQVQILSDEDAGKLFKAILEYVNTKELPTLDGMAAMAFSFIANQLDGEVGDSLVHNARSVGSCIFLTKNSQ